MSRPIMKVSFTSSFLFLLEFTQNNSRTRPAIGKPVYDISRPTQYLGGRAVGHRPRIPLTNHFSPWKTYTPTLP